VHGESVSADNPNLLRFHNTGERTTGCRSAANYRVTTMGIATREIKPLMKNAYLRNVRRKKTLSRFR